MKELQQNIIFSAVIFHLANSSETERYLDLHFLEVDVFIWIQHSCQTNRLCFGPQQEYYKEIAEYFSIIYSNPNLVLGQLNWHAFPSIFHNYMSRNKDMKNYPHKILIRVMNDIRISETLIVFHMECFIIPTQHYTEDELGQCLIVFCCWLITKCRPEVTYCHGVFSFCDCVYECLLLLGVVVGTEGWEGC